MALARILTSTTVIAALTAAHALALVFPCALVLGDSGAPAVAVTRILAFAAAITGLTAALAFAAIPGCAYMLVAVGVSAL